MVISLVTFGIFITIFIVKDFKENKQNGQISTDFEIYLAGIPAIAVAVLLSACSTTNTAKNMHSETHAVGNGDNSSLQASQDEFESMVRNIDVKSRIMDQYADWKGVRYRLGGSTKKVLIVQASYSVRSASNLV